MKTKESEIESNQHDFEMQPFFDLPIDGNERSEKDARDVDRVDAVFRVLTDALESGPPYHINGNAYTQIDSLTSDLSSQLHRLVYPRKITPKQRRRGVRQPEAIGQEGIRHMVDWAAELAVSAPELHPLKVTQNTVLQHMDKLAETDELEDQTLLHVLGKFWENEPSSQQDRGLAQFTAKQLLLPLTLDDSSEESPIPASITSAWQNPYFVSAATDEVVASIESRWDGGRVAGTEDEYTDYESLLQDKLFEAYGFSQEEAQDIRFALRSPRRFYEYKLHKRTPELISSTLRIPQYPQYVARSLKAMSKLGESAGLDAPKQPYTRFGIRHFARYRTDTLKAQLAKKDEQLGGELVVGATDDWNLAFGGSTERSLAGLELGNPTYIEAASLTEFTRWLVRYARATGQPVETVVINAHGSPDAILLGKQGPTEYSRITSSLVEESVGASRLVKRGIMSASTEVILYSCDTGEARGIGEAIALRTGVKVVAPDHKPGGPVKNGAGEVTFRRNEGGNSAVIYERDASSKHSSRRITE